MPSVTMMAKDFGCPSTSIHLNSHVRVVAQEALVSQNASEK
jgi:hypothetical protein